MTTNNLTEQWKRGELKDGFYYADDDGGELIILIRGKKGSVMGDDFDLKATDWIKPIAPVPNYEEWQPFTDPYFRGLTTKDIAELAKKSIRLCKQSCDDNTTIQNLKELLGYCADILEEWDDKDRDIEILLEEVDEALK